MILDHLEALERALAPKNFPPMSDWWRATVTDFYQAPRRQLVLRVGRRGGKSSTLCRIAVLEALFGEHAIPAGDVGVVAIVSVSRDQADERLKTIKAILSALGVAYHPIAGGIELDSKPVAFKTFTASIAGVVGFTAICIICDEVARWRDAETGANPATEVLASLRPTLAGQPHAKIFLSSSPLGNQDAHAGAFDRGDDSFQLAFCAPTWVARPSLTEAETHELEPDEKLWSREYAAVPSDTVSIALDPALVRAAVRMGRPGSRPISAPIIGFDSSMGRGDAAAWLVAEWYQADANPGDEWETVNTVDGPQIVIEPNGLWRRKNEVPERPRPELLVYGIGALTGKFAARGITSDDMVKAVTAVARDACARHVVSDQFQGYALTSAFMPFGLQYTPQVWSVESKGEALIRLRAWLRDGTLAIEPSDEGEALVKELLNLQETIRPSGSIGLGARRGHDDRACALLSVAMADSVGFMAGSPIAKQNGLIVDSPIHGRSYYGGARPPQ
jgi:hypothetical protein